MKIISKLLPLALTLLLFSACEKEKAEQGNIQPFHLSQVRLLDGPFAHAASMNEAYVMVHDLDRLLAPFLIDAGLEPKAPRYGNWENIGLDGHTAGHFLTSFSLMVASTGNEEALKRLNYMIDELERCQIANGDGYVGGIPGGREMWKEIANGHINAGNFSLNGKWVPWYNIHKLYAGLRDAYLLAGNEKAFDMLIALTDWCIELVANLSAEQIQEMLVSEHGGVNEVFADVYDITGDEKYLKLARQFSHHLILDPLLVKEDRLTGLHANTQIPKVVGFMRIAELADDKEWKEASDFFWNTVVNNRSVVIGGNSTYEHFHQIDDFSSMIESRQGPETCNTYNMMKLSQMLYFSSHDLKYLDYYERALYNHILPSIHPEHGGLVYFTSMRPRHYRVYSNPEETFWCCVGSGIENHAKYGELIYARDDLNNVYVNLFIPSVLNWEENGLKITQETAFPETESSKFIVNVDNSSRFTVFLRHPNWIDKSDLQVKVNGRNVRGKSNPGEYFAVTRQWKDGDVIEISLPMYTYGEEMPDGSPYMALLHGPLVLTGHAGTEDLIGLIADDSRMGHVAHGPLVSREDAPVLLAGEFNLEDKVRPVPGKPLTFSASDLIFPDEFRDMELMPFYMLHDARYMVYWQTSTREELESIRQELQEREREMLELEASTLDAVETGQQQPESERNFKGERTETGVHQNRHWRHAHGWFSYELSDPENQASTLRVTYFGGDAGRNFDILMNGELLTTVNLDGSQGDRFFDVNYEIPQSIKSKKSGNYHEVRFQAHENSIAGGVFYVRLLK
ncbi:glycoside hydrolase family 127 protein [Alkalitalea saponilacus]|uniref:Uncharacterized protein n=1 Tax=Alkalitalea saponilacus TaxID=889453 RepID=A0A1T5ADL3_9BACT|nr:glycoside hydrolase family 127 protein [Alkalitalea saponilacus]ASB48749.1 glycosyl hydrolase [Alkalitalea saponilacus]SKB32827.1 hypothetical protein SAMN03080601_00207 [Alkalitalea saponilacus]